LKSLVAFAVLLYPLLGKGSNTEAASEQKTGIDTGAHYFELLSLSRLMISRNKRVRYIYIIEKTNITICIPGVLRLSHEGIYEKRYDNDDRETERCRDFKRERERERETCQSS
jgi:hypothetical protein